MINEFLVISDLHLERKKELEKNFILNVINEKLNERREKGFNPILACVGDVDNGDIGLEFLSKINSQVLYLCGNHEFWENDYLETLDKLNRNNYENITFLHNDLVVLNDFIFIGATLWSDLGKTLNPDLFPHAKNVMNDIKRITYKKWYESEENCLKIKELFPLSYENVIENKEWNIIAEREENDKSVSFFNDCEYVLSLLEKIPSLLEKIKDNISYDFREVSEEEKLKLQFLINLKDTDITFKEWFSPIKDFISYQYKHETVNYTEGKERAFSKLKNHSNLKDLKLIMLTHHMPFLEERLIGHQEWFDRKIKENLFTTLPDYIYGLRHSVDYPHDYLYRLGKGDFDKDNSITHVIHYANDGSANFTPQLIKRTYALAHGHEHAYNYEGLLKGIKVIANPLSHSMAVFRFDEKTGQTYLNEGYLSYRKVKDEQAEIEDLKKSFLRVSNLSLTKEESQLAAKLWSLKNFRWDEYLKLIEYCEKLNSKIFYSHIENPQWQDGMNEEEEFELQVLVDAMDKTLYKIKKMENRLDESVTIRASEDYSFNLKFSNAQEMIHISQALKGFEKTISLGADFSTNSDWRQSMFIQHSFTNKEVLAINKRETLKRKAIIDKFPDVRLNEITSKMAHAYDNAFKKCALKRTYGNNEIMQKLHEEKERLNYQEPKLKGLDF